MNRNAVIFCLALGSLLGACRETVYFRGQPLLTGEEVGVLTAEISPTQFSDVPVPGDFELQRQNQESFGSQVGNFRMGHFVYYGGLLPDEVERYVIERMPQHGWSAQGREESGGILLLRFAKGDTTAQYRIARTEASEASSTRTPVGSPEKPKVFTKLLIDIHTGGRG